MARSGLVDYDRFSYCRKCQIKYPKNHLRCLECGHLVSHRPLSRSRSKYWETEKKLVYY